MFIKTTDECASFSMYPGMGPAQTIHWLVLACVRLGYNQDYISKKECCISHITTYNAMMVQVFIFISLCIV